MEVCIIDVILEILVRRFSSEGGATYVDPFQKNTTKKIMKIYFFFLIVLLNFVVKHGGGAFRLYMRTYF